ncbi:MAG TPA: EVE domain-containing protein [Rhodospirillaceae bacterium]|nr:EVE domain-containing protein [Rhodospirillaceae bacterium]
MAYFLLKSEPDAWSWQQQQKVKLDPWTGVRNHQAANFMKAMRLGDTAFFYHSNIGKEIVGIVEVVREAYPDPTDETGKFVCVNVAAKESLARPVTLAEIKLNKKLQEMHLIRQSRLSVMPVTDAQWREIIRISNTK